MNLLTCQKNLFDLDDEVTYLNLAYMSPLLKSVARAGVNAVNQKLKPWQVYPVDFFSQVDKAKHLFSRLINSHESQRVAIIPSISYGITNAARNIQFNKGDQIILLDKQFPSNVFPWQDLAKEKDLKIDMIPVPESTTRGADWNAEILNTIQSNTKVVSIEHVHWTDGTKFDLEAISKKAKSVGALLIIDATQSIGNLRLDQSKIQADVIVATGYKSLLGPYAIGFAYYNSYFDNGMPIENNWINKSNSENFEGLLNYEQEYKPQANRYSMGEQSQFIHMPMQVQALEQILEWGVENIQAYSKSILDPILPLLHQKKIWIENEMHRSNHLFGLKPSKKIDQTLKQRIRDENIFVSYRDSSIRVSTHLYNDRADLEKLIDIL